MRRKTTILALMILVSVSLWGCLERGIAAVFVYTKEGSRTGETVFWGQVGELGCGYLAYAVPERENEDYRLYFFRCDTMTGPLRETGLCLDAADYIFPDVKEKNSAPGRFLELYFLDVADITGDGREELLAIARYEKDGREYYDTRVYEIREDGIRINYRLIRELNEKYDNGKEYPVHELYGWVPDVYLEAKLFYRSRMGRFMPRRHRIMGYIGNWE